MFNAEFHSHLKMQNHLEKHFRYFKVLQIGWLCTIYSKKMNCEEINNIFGRGFV